MELTVLIPHADWRETAGVRIRYDRLAPALAARGHKLKLAVINEFRAGTSFDSDVYLFSKTYDASAQILARMILAQGRRVGVDFFDDYFSQVDDSRLVHMRRWFKGMAQVMSFALCASVPMRSRLHRLAPGLPVHVVNDPAGGFDRAAVAATVAHKADWARAERRLDIGWFGIGDNPYFDVGLSDLHAFGESLATCRRMGYSTRLRILTNQRALTPERLEMLARLPVELTLEEWSEERERALIAESLFCLLPVNGQSFSTVKSLNRALTALTGGAQVLSLGYPLYDSFDAFVYRRAEDLIGDLEQDCLKLSEARLDDLAGLLSRYGDAEAEAAALVTFLDSVPAPAARAWPGPGVQAAMIHGMGSSGEVHKAVQRVGCLSVAAPQSTMKVNFDVACKPLPDGNGLDITLSKIAMSRLRPDQARHARKAGERDGKPIYRLRLEAGDLPDAARLERPSRPPLQIVELARYDWNIRLMRQVLDRLFERPEVFLSERLSPYWATETGQTEARG